LIEGRSVRANLAMKQKTTLSVGGILLAIAAAIFYPRHETPAGPDSTPTTSAPAPVASSSPAATPATTPGATTPATSPAPAPPAKPKPAGAAPVAPQQPTPAAPPAAKAPAAGGLPPSTSKVGFTSRESWQSHFEKHGHEFGKITAEDYLALAKSLRDAPLSSNVLELKRDDGVVSRFDRKSGGFVAFNKDQTIRTFFRPNDGEAYFKRQAAR
jgi:pyocin large subunit-like protein